MTMSRAPALATAPLIPGTPDAAQEAPPGHAQIASGSQRLPSESVSMGESELFRTNVIEEHNPQFQEGPVELRRKRLKRIRGMDGRHGRIVQWFFSRCPLKCRIGRRNAAVRIDLEGGVDHALLPHTH